MSERASTRRSRVSWLMESNTTCKTVPLPEILTTRTVTANRRYLSPTITELILKDYIRLLGKADCSDSPTLTSRERDVLKLLSEGRTPKEIAHQMGLSVKTIETHRQQLMNKLNLHSIAGITKYAIRQGLTSIET